VDVFAHFVSARASLLKLAQHIAAGGAGLPEDFDYDTFNAQEQTRLRDQSPQELLRAKKH